MNILLPTTITRSMIGAGTNIPEIDADAGEVAWAAGAYVADDRRVFDGKIYACVKAHTSTSSSPTPPNDQTNWL